MRSLLRGYGAVAVDDARAAALEMGVPECRFVRRYPERMPRPPMALRQVDPLIRELTLNRDSQPRPQQPHDQGDLMNLVELDRALRQLRLGGMATVLESRPQQAQTERMAPIDLISLLVSDELRRRADCLLERQTKHAHLRDDERTLDHFDFDFSKKMNRRLIYELAAGHLIAKREDILFLGPPGTGKSRLAQATAARLSSRAIECCTAKPTISSRNSRTPPSTAPARRQSPNWPPSPCSSSTTSACASCHPPRPRTCSNWSCAATNAPVRSSPRTGR